MPHTPTPYHLVEREFGFCLFPEEGHNPARLGPGGTTIGCVAIVRGMGDADRDNARFLLRAGNAHYALLAACEGALAALDELAEYHPGVPIDPARAALRDAIALARE